MEQQNGAARWMRDLLCGLLIGAGAILPGVSGGVLAVIFGIYRPFMEVLADPFRELPRYWMWLPPLGIGWAIGFFGVAKIIILAMDLSMSATVWLFIGLILGTVPALFRDAGREGRPVSARWSFAAAFIGMFLLLFYFCRIARFHVEPDFGWYSFCGMLWGLGIVVPGMTSSSVMMALDLYRPVMDGLADFDLPVLLSTLPGMLLTILALARGMNWVFRRHYPIAAHGILGVVLASTLVIIPTTYQTPTEAVLSAVCCAAGCGIALLMDRLDSREHGQPG